MDEDDFYSTLGVPRTAEPWLIQFRYRALMRRFHPDAGTEPDIAKAQRVNQAYEVLGDPEKRRRYDARTEPAKPPAPEAERKAKPSPPKVPRAPKRKPKRTVPKIPAAVRRHRTSDGAILWWFVCFYFLMAALLYLRR
jgi:curved DNA-binding protein CbpA